MTSTSPPGPEGAGERPEGSRAAEETTPPIRPAASLVVFDERDGELWLLMGRRARTHVFMPGLTVFPGGRVERCDWAVSDSIRSPKPAWFEATSGAAGARDTKSWQASALAAIRETAEETGAIVGAAGHFEAVEPQYAVFADAGIVPRPDWLVPFARAITPPGLPRRYDTLFFAVSAANLAVGPGAATLLDDEFDRVGWLSRRDLDHVEMASITRLVLNDFLDRQARGIEETSDVAIPLYHTVEGRHRRDRI